ncbi:MAG: hypothetical protein ABIM46_06115, partial [candidate division WOR-3 bacterium]
MLLYFLLSVALEAEIKNLGEYGPFEVTVSPEGSSNGSAWGFKAWKSDGGYVIINGKEWGPYEDAWGPSFSSDGSAWGFKAKKSYGYYVLFYVIINGKEW